MEAIKLIGNISDLGSLALQNRDRLVEWLRKNSGKEIEVAFKRKRKHRSHPQNAYYWGVVIKEIHIRLNELGYQSLTDEDVHDMMKLKFNHTVHVSETGEYLEIPKSTTELNTIEFCEYCERIRQWAADFLEINIPDPNQDTTFFNT